MTKLTHQELLRILRYNPKTGTFTWLVDRANGKIKAGDLAGNWDGDRCRIVIGGKKYSASRLAYFYMNGYWPMGEMDHINRVSVDDRWENLREVTSTNRIMPRRNSKNVGLPIGVVRRGKRFEAAMKHNKKCNYLGTFDTAEEAGVAYLEAVHMIHGRDLINGNKNLKRRT